VVQVAESSLFNYRHDLLNLNMYNRKLSSDTALGAITTKSLRPTKVYIMGILHALLVTGSFTSLPPPSRTKQINECVTMSNKNQCFNEHLQTRNVYPWDKRINNVKQ